MNKIIKEFEGIISELDYLEEDIIFHEAGETLQLVGEEISDRFIIINAKLKALFNEIKDNNEKNTN